MDNVVSINPQPKNLPDRMCGAFLDIAEQEGASHEEMMQAIAQLLVFKLSLICPDCRAQALDEFGDLLPTFARDAAEMAAHGGGELGCH